MDPSLNNKRIAKNSIMLYFRTALVLVISLYTSRLILKALGAEDLGIYNVVGGIVALMSFLRTSFSKATSRFITFEIGRSNDPGTLSRIFSSALTIHILIAVIVFVLGETLGILILKNWTDIPEVRQQAAFGVYQCALIIFCIQIVTSPYESIILANEKMTVFAYMSIFSAVTKLGIAVIMLSSRWDRLILYGVMMVLMDALVFLFYYLYDRNKFPVFKFNLTWDHNYSRGILGFSGWTLFGSSANAATQQGVSLLFNNFIGLIANAALGFATQVYGAVLQFVHSFQMAFNPQVVKFYAQDELGKMHLLISRASKFSFILAYVLALPLIFNMEFVLHIWLGEVPIYTVEFCQLILICSVIDATTGIFNTSITATGKIRGFQIGITISFLLDLATCAVLLVIGLTPALVFASRILTRGIINMLIELYYVRKQLSFSLRKYFITVIIPIIVTIIVTVPLMIIIKGRFSQWWDLVISLSVSVICCSLLVWFVFMTRSEKRAILSMALNRFHLKS